MKKATTTKQLLLPLTLLLCSSLSQSLTTDGVVLLAFKLSILNDPLHLLDSWNIYDDVPCSWHGVSCALDSPRVISLSLPNSHLSGSLPSNLALLDQLQSLNLSSNSINGTLPDSLFSLPNLRLLDLSNNLISGGLSDFIGGLRSLQVLHLANNHLSGIIPRNVAALQNLSSVYFSNNNFSGNLPGGFDHVRVIDFSSNMVNGSLPSDFGGGSVEYFNLSYNRISGEIPPEFVRKMPDNATLDFSYNNLTGEIPDSKVLQKQNNESFTGNPDLCGPPLGNPCGSDSSPIPQPSAQPIPSPAIAARPKTWSSSPANSGGDDPIAPKQEDNRNNNKGKNNGLRPHIIVAIVVGDLAGVAILSMIFLHLYRKKSSQNESMNQGSKGGVINRERSTSSYSSSSSESKGLAKWSCLRKTKREEVDEGEEEEEEEEDETDEEEGRGRSEEQGQMVTVDGEKEVERETLLKASAYMLGVSGSSIMYKAVLEDGSALAVRRVGDGLLCGNNNGGERLKDFEVNVRAIAKLMHPNLVRVRAFYWAANEKLIIYEYVPNGSLANARPRKAGSSPCNMPWEVRFRIAKGVARGLTYIHEKKHVHGNLKPSNILLDKDMEPKISDLGLDRLTTGKSGYIPCGSTRHFGSKRSTASRESIQDYSIGATPSPSASSIGCVSPYHPPESLRSLKPNPKWDVYSFGIVLLELLTGKVVVSDELGPPVLAGLAVGLEDRTRILRMADVAIRAELEGKEEALFTCLKLGYNCISHVPQKRPSMKEALQTLEKVTTSSTPSSSYYFGP